MRYVHKIRDALKEVYASERYYVLTLGVALVIYLFNTLVNNYRILFYNFSFPLLFSLIQGTFVSMTPLSLFLLIIISLLAGIVTAMTVFLIKRQVTGQIVASSSGIIVSLITPTCPSCAIGLLSVLGFGGFLTVLPFKGLELGIVGIGLL